MSVLPATRRGARPPASLPGMSTVALVAYDRIPLFHLSIACEVFGADRSDMGVPRHEVLVVRGEPGRLRSDGGVVLDVDLGLEMLDRADIVIVPSWRVADGDVPPAPLLEALRRAAARGARIIGLCGGAFVLAAAGLLDGRRATTHWLFTERLAAQYPAVDVDPRVLCVEDGTILTSAGTAAAIDLCLHIVRRMHGAEIANTIARRMVVPAHRAGGQAQFIEAPVPETADDDRLARALAWGLRHLDRPLSVDDLAARAFMSRRTFTRRFKAALGTTPLQWLLTQRLTLAQRLLETSDLPVEAVAERAGFGSAVAFRTQFRQAFDTSPRAYRQTFSAAPAALAAAG
jgi:transcriptional regulator GlxA family with amidase domain